MYRRVIVPERDNAITSSQIFAFQNGRIGGSVSVWGCARHDPPEKTQCDRNGRQNDQGRTHQTAILRAQQYDLRWDGGYVADRIIHRRRLSELTTVIAKSFRKARSRKPRVGFQNYEISGRPHAEPPTILGTKNLHGFLLTPCAWPWFESRRSPAESTNIVIRPHWRSLRAPQPISPLA